MTRGRMQSADRQLLDRAKLWNAGIKAQFVSIPPTPASYPHPPEDMTAGKWF